jgi:hypothetical protein
LASTVSLEASIAAGVAVRWRIRHDRAVAPLAHRSGGAR